MDAGKERFTQPNSARWLPRCWIEEALVMDGLLQRPGNMVAEYTGAAAGRDYDYWREGVCRNFCRVDAEPSAGSQIFCKIEITQVGSLALATTSGRSGRFVRSRDLLSDSCDDFVLFAATSGDVLVVRERRAVELQQSQMWLTDLTVEGAVAFNDGNEFATIRIPRRELLAICPDAESRLAEPLVASPGIRDVIARYYALAADVATSLDPIGQQMTARHMVDLVALLLRTGRDETQVATQRGYSEARLRLIQTEVLDRLHDCSLTIGSIARSIGLSPKQVQRLFERSGMTFTEFVLEQRLLAARRLLSSPNGRHGKIGTVAYSVGFGDLSYFNRTFRGRFGVTPSEWRDTQPAFS
jgi:AraC-like DNA-binding protein